MIPQHQVTAAAAVPLSSLVGRDRPLKRDGRLWEACCPFHNERTPSFKLFPDNHYHCFGCGAHGSAITYVMRTQRVGFAEAVAILTGGHYRVIDRPDSSRGTIPPKLAARSEPPFSCPDDRTAQYVRKLWDGAQAPRLAEVYLWSRAIRVRPKPIPLALRGHKAAWCSEARQKRPAVVAALTEDSGAVVAVQRIWVKSELDVTDGVPVKGSRATDLKAGKTTFGRMGSAAVRLAEPRKTLGLAEGVESSMSATQLFSIPCWAACGTRLGSIAIPDGVEEIVIFGDNGGAGHDAAKKAVESYRKQGYRADAEFPPPGCGDWNDYLREQV